MVRSISAEEQILAAGYVLGDLDPLESKEFELALTTDPDLWAEVSALQVAFDKVPQGLIQITPPPALKAKIIESFVALASTSDSTVNLPQPTVTETTSVPTKRFNWSRLLAGIGLLTGGLLAFDNFNLRQQIQFAQQIDRQELASILTQPKSRLLALSDRQDRVLGKVLWLFTT